MWCGAYLGPLGLLGGHDGDLVGELDGRLEDGTLFGSLNKAWLFFRQEKFLKKPCLPLFCSWNHPKFLFYSQRCYFYRSFLHLTKLRNYNIFTINQCCEAWILLEPELEPEITFSALAPGLRNRNYLFIKYFTILWSDLEDAKNE